MANYTNMFFISERYVTDHEPHDLGKRDFGSWPAAEFRTVLERCVDWAVTGAFPG